MEIDWSENIPLPFQEGREIKGGDAERQVAVVQQEVEKKAQHHLVRVGKSIPQARTHIQTLLMPGGVVAIIYSADPPKKSTKNVQT